MKNKLFAFFTLLVFLILCMPKTFAYNNNFYSFAAFKALPASLLAPLSSNSALYMQMNLGNYGLDEKAFEYAMNGYNYLKSKKILLNKNVISIIDFTKPSTQKRLFVLDLKTNKILYNTYVAHGQASGQEYATHFSNTPESLQSSLGFYKTANTYDGKNGFSLVLKGLEKGVNDLAEERSIVMHGAPYVSQNYINETGALGRSWGCPAVAENLAKPIIEKIKLGSCLFVYSANKNYLKTSTIIHR